jgi:hypothetical protein
VEGHDGSIFSKQVTKNGWRLDAGKENYDTLGGAKLLAPTGGCLWKLIRPCCRGLP